ncbi:MIS factor, partial [Spelaeornis formosus]|nr:MIS factor [Elachura formosa]
TMSALGELLLCLVLLLPSAALPRRAESDSRRELRLLEELGLGAEGREVGNRSLQETARFRRAAGTQLFPKPKCPQGGAEEGDPGWTRSSPQPWPLGGLEGPVCRVRMEQDGATPRHLEVVGVLSHYESSFIKLLRQRRSWDGNFAGTFGLCRAGEEAGAAPHPLQRIHGHVLEPGLERFLVLHLEEVQWEAQVKLRFQLLFQPEVGRALGELQAAVMLFYLGHGSGHPRELLVTGSGLPRDQVGPGLGGSGGCPGLAALCRPSRSIQPLQLPLLTTPNSFIVPLPIPSQSIHNPLLVHSRSPPNHSRSSSNPFVIAPTPPPSPPKEALFPYSYLSTEGVVDTAPYPQLSPPQTGAEELPTPTAPSQANASSPALGGSAEFLAILARFIRQLLSSSSEPPPEPSAHHWLDFEVMETLPHELLNLSEEAALERLVQSEEPSVLLLPQDSGAVLEQHLGDWQPEGTVLQLLMGKLQLVIQELSDIPAFQANAALFQHLLSFCHYPAEPGQTGAAEPDPGPRKLRTLLLLKALQSVRARWQERRKVQRQNRSARQQAHCRLQELTIDLRDRRFIIMPTAYTGNNCEGSCRLPLSSRIPSYFSHTVLLLGMQERGSPLRRAPCCVPVRYSGQLIISLSSDGLQIRKFPNMVAEECGCR